MNNKQIDRSAFIGTEFDCEFTDDNDSDWYPSPLTRITFVTDGEVQTDKQYHCCVDQGVRYCRPRLSKPQVLTDYSKVLVHGLVWNVCANNYKQLNNEPFIYEKRSSNAVKYICGNDNYTVQWLECIGVEAGKGYDEWAEDHAMPLIELGSV